MALSVRAVGSDDPLAGPIFAAWVKRMTELSRLLAEFGGSWPALWESLTVGDVVLMDEV